MKSLLCTLLLAALGTAAAKADTLNIAFDQPIQVATAGNTVEFFGTITNNSASTVFLNADSFTLEGTSFTIADQFFNIVPVSLDPGQNSGDIELFDITTGNPLSDPAGLFAGTYTLLGGADGDAQDVLGSGSFAVNTVPEPSSLYLLLTGGLAALAPAARKLRRTA